MRPLAAPNAGRSIISFANVLHGGLAFQAILLQDEFVRISARASPFDLFAWYSFGQARFNYDSPVRNLIDCAGNLLLHEQVFGFVPGKADKLKISNCALYGKLYIFPFQKSIDDDRSPAPQ